MARTHDRITDDLRAFIQRQPVFFVATAPLGAAGHVNVSPKGLDTFRVLAPDHVAYLDLVGSGNETAAHLLENRRVTFLFCSFGDKPLILRLYGQGRAVQPGAADWPDLFAHFTPHPGTRQIIDAHITRVQTSCGFGVPQMALVAPRPDLPRWADAQGPANLAAYQQKHNRTSLDGLPARPNK